MTHMTHMTHNDLNLDLEILAMPLLRQISTYRFHARTPDIIQCP